MKSKNSILIGNDHNFQVEELRQRVEEKNRQIEKKTQIALQATQERNRFTAELNEMRDHLDIRDRKINVLQRKVRFQSFQFFFGMFFSNHKKRRFIKFNLDKLRVPITHKKSFLVIALQ